MLTRQQATALAGLKWLFGIALLCFILWCITSCSRTQAASVPRGEFMSPEEAHQAAVNHTDARVGDMVLGPTTGESMEPVIYQGDYIVVRPVKFEEVQKEKPYTYAPKHEDFPLLPKDFNSYVTHYAALKDSGGWLMSGVNAPLSDSNVRMTSRNLIGEVIFVAHLKR